jgi:hypothetical protein
VCIASRQVPDGLVGKEGVGGKRGNQEKEVGDWRDRERIDVKSPKRKA